MKAFNTQLMNSRKFKILCAVQLNEVLMAEEERLLPLFWFAASVWSTMLFTNASMCRGLAFRVSKTGGSTLVKGIVEALWGLAGHYSEEIWLETIPSDPYHTASLPISRQTSSCPPKPLRLVLLLFVGSDWFNGGGHLGFFALDMVPHAHFEFHRSSSYRWLIKTRGLVPTAVFNDR